MRKKMSAKVSVCIIDDDESVRLALTDLLESAGLDAEAFSSGSRFLESRRDDHLPNCLILDVRLPEISGLDFQTELSAAGIEIPIVFITGHGDIPMSVQAMKAGAVDFLAKPFRDQDLLDAIHRAVERDRSGRKQRAETNEVRRRFAELTPRERDVMGLVIRGLLNKQIASELGASETTIKVHRAHAMRKMQAESLPDLVRMAEKLSLSAS
jgi:FixJ family two-component response regulator